MKTKSDDLQCPTCGKKTIQPIEYWEHNGKVTDFLAIHEVKTVEVQTATGFKWSYSSLVSGCDKTGRLTK